MKKKREPKSSPEWEELMKHRPKLADKMNEDVGRGVSKDLLDRAFWLSADDGSPDYELEEWVRAFIKVDKGGDPSALIEKLKVSKGVIPPNVLPHFCDLLERKLSKGKGGRPRTPSYDRPEKELWYDCAVEDLRRAVEDLKQANEKVDWENEVKRVARQFWLDPEDLKMADRGTGPRWYKEAKAKRRNKKGLSGG